MYKYNSYINCCDKKREKKKTKFFPHETWDEHKPYVWLRNKWNKCNNTETYFIQNKNYKQKKNNE